MGDFFLGEQFSWGIFFWWFFLDTKTDIMRWKKVCYDIIMNKTFNKSKLPLFQEIIFEKNIFVLTKQHYKYLLFFTTLNYLIGANILQIVFDFIIHSIVTWIWNTKVYSKWYCARPEVCILIRRNRSALKKWLKLSNESFVPLVELINRAVFPLKELNIDWSCFHSCSFFWK